MRLSFRLAAVLALALSAVTACHADTYSITRLFTDEGTQLVGFDKGNFSFEQFGCTIGSIRYQECYINSGPGGDSFTPAITTFDVGTPCTVSAPGYNSLYKEICNNGHLAVIATTPRFPDVPFVYVDGNTTSPIFESNAAGFLYLDAEGDFIYNNPQSELWYEAFDLTTAATPEPSSLALLGTGLLGVGAAARRRWRGL